MKAPLILLACLLLLGLNACSGASSAPNRLQWQAQGDGRPLVGTVSPSVSNPGLTLPAPATFAGSQAGPVERQASTTPLYLSRFNISQSFHSQNIGSQMDSYTHFEPTLTASSGLDGMAFAVFTIAAGTAPELSPVLQLNFIESGNLADFQIALGNYGTNRWDWYQPESESLLRINSWLDYFQQDSPLLIVLAFRGSSPWVLSSGWIGNPLPTFSLSSSADSFQIPTEVTVKVGNLNDTFDTTAIEWDMDNNGVFEYSSSPAEREHSFTYDSVGLKTVSVRLIDTLGEANTNQTTFHCTDHRARSWGLSGDERAEAIAQDSQGGLYLVGSKDADTGLLIKYDASMNLEWAREWDAPGGDDEFNCVAVHNDEVFVAGTQLPILGLGHKLLLQRWSANGELLSQKIMGPDNHDTVPSQLIDAGSGLLLCGRGYSSSDFENRALLLSFSPALALNWGKAFTDSSAPQTLDSAVAVAAFNSGDIYVLAGEDGGSGGFGLLHLDSSGGLLGESYYDGNPNLEPKSLFLSPANVHVCASTGSEIQLSRFSPALLLQDDLGIDSNAVPGSSGFVDAGGRWVFCSADGSDAAYWQIDYATPSGRYWSYSFGGFSNKSGGLAILSSSDSYSFICGYADWATDMSISKSELLSADFSQLSASSLDPNFDLSSYSQSISSTSTAASPVNGVEDNGGESSSVQGDFALFRFGSEE